MKNIMKIMCFSTIGLVVAGCGGSDTESGEEQVQLTYAIWDDNQRDGLREIGEAFTEEHPHISVDIQVLPLDQYWTRLDATAQSDSMPDIFWMHSDEANRYMQNEVLMDLSEAEIEWEMFPEELVELYSLEETRYAVPKDFDTIGLWYNHTMFDEAGLDYPNEDWTWDDFLEAARELTNEEEGVYGFGAQKNNQIGYMNFIYQNDGEVYNEDKDEYLFNSPNSVEALEFYTSLILEEGVSPSLQQLEETSSETMFQSGNVAMVMNGSWMVAPFMDNDYVRENGDVAVLPYQERRASIFNGLGHAASASTNHPEEVQLFIEFLGSEEANIIQGETAIAIPAYEGTADTWIENTNTEFNTEVFVEMLDYAEILPYSHQTARVNDVTDDGLTDVFTGEISAQEGADRIAEQANSILQE